MLKFDKSKLVKDLARGNILIPHLEQVFNSFDEDFQFTYQPKGSDDAWHPSGDCVPPVTSLYAKATGASTYIPPSGLTRKKFLVGHFWHALIQYIVLNKLNWCEPEAVERVQAKQWGMEGTDFVYHPKPYHWVRGAGDIAPLITPNWRGVLDIKTMRHDDFKVGTLPQWAALKYKCQINIYMDLFDEERGLFLLIDKDTQEFREIEVKRDQPLIDSIYAKWKIVSDCLDAGIAPREEDDQAYTLHESE